MQTKAKKRMAQDRMTDEFVGDGKGGWQRRPRTINDNVRFGGEHWTMTSIEHATAAGFICLLARWPYIRTANEIAASPVGLSHSPPEVTNTDAVIEPGISVEDLEKMKEIAKTRFPSGTNIEDEVKGLKDLAMDSEDAGLSIENIEKLKKSGEKRAHSPKTTRARQVKPPGD